MDKNYSSIGSQTPQQARGDIMRIIANALAEDIGKGDITSQLLIPKDTHAEMLFVAREPMIACGTFIPAEVYKQLDTTIKAEACAREGQNLKKGDILAKASGAALSILTGERVVLNLMQRMCGVATLTHSYVEAVRGTKAIILDTRKTMPGLRMFDKYAVTMGGGKNHRLRLDDMILIKDNHIALCGSVSKAIEKARAGAAGLPIVVECDTLTQVEEALKGKPDRILLDNMDVDHLHHAVQLAAGKIPLEASGGVSLDTVRAIAETGVDYISVGAITHSAIAVDIGADVSM